MDLFLKLCLAHLIADFVLQFEELYQLKVRHPFGHVLHVMIHWIVSVALAFPFLNRPSVWLFITLLTAVHYGQDRAKYDGRTRWPRYEFPIFMADQLLHFLWIALVLFLPASRQPVALLSPPWLDLLYRAPEITLGAMAWITATFAGAYILNCMRLNYLPQSRADHFITSFEMGHALIERTFVAGIFLLAPPAAMLASPGLGLLRLFSARLRNRTDFILSFVFAAAVGLFFRRWISSP